MNKPYELSYCHRIGGGGLMSCTWAEGMEHVEKHKAYWASYSFHRVGAEVAHGLYDLIWLPPVDRMKLYIGSVPVVKSEALVRDGLKLPDLLAHCEPRELPDATIDLNTIVTMMGIPIIGTFDPPPLHHKPMRAFVFLLPSFEFSELYDSADSDRAEGLAEIQHSRRQSEEFHSREERS